jgi:2-keto-3-deoxy-6-phosphogluconate aldolase
VGVPIHVIGGIAGDASPAEVRGFAAAAVACRASGASLYDASITSAEQWRHLTRMGQLPEIE